MGKGAILEGLTSEVLSLVQQDTSGKIEVIRDKTTYQQDGGVDVVASVKEGEDFISYWDKLVEDSKQDHNPDNKPRG
ncbi:hypothetical protein VXK10_002888 [Vibrio parahaemolyticus]|uniref:hypothetical protein n=1 Tax=Vibrio parahaemolyticus TaxID=670 RepID=UPI00067C4A45|nr:hypothetical protein [Vibrio parahaemolyticus]EKD9042295.1 hypothetical protein [Vibrio parahaemolyticus]EKL0189389.1 hypothetical protein [Vibrio parahaemolyticus]ELA7199194.1 hypothetical protein [Vibrio parahaemolyticus]EME0148634.1 hypothetical protein [Vibrio parahaemolyticus]EME0861938.1 hypothetical protein [Vibrio parahaemolyticus]